MSSVITANLLSEAVNRNKNDASLLSLPGYEIIKCIFENNFNKVYLSVSNHPRSLSAQKDAIFVIKSIAVDVSPTDFSELLLTQTNTNDDNKIDQINAHLEVQLDVTASLAAEINILKLVSHTNIIELHYVFCEVSIDFGGHLFLGMS